MSEKVTEKAILLCDKGAKPSQLKVMSQDFCLIENKRIATEGDIAPELNIPNFGVCSLTQNTCCPAPAKWQKTASKDTINNFKVLTQDSSCQCSLGGKISIQFKGYTESHQVS